jgi:hypothetical protein
MQQLVLSRPLASVWTHVSHATRIRNQNPLNEYAQALGDY